MTIEYGRRKFVKHAGVLAAAAALGIGAPAATAAAFQLCKHSRSVLQTTPMWP